MAKTNVTQWDTTAANNTDINSIPIDGAVTTPSQVDNIVREMMAQIKAGISASYFIPAAMTLPKIWDTSATHKYNFGVSELAADRTITLPLLTGNDTFVFEAHTQTLTNKTLTTPTLTLKQSAAPVPTAEGAVEWDTDDNVLAIGDGAATKLFVPIPASTAAGDIEYFDGAKSTARLAKGTAGQALVMNSGATAPQWSTINYGTGYAAVTAGTVGSLMFAFHSSSGTVSYGSTVAGSTLQPTGLSSAGDNFNSGSAPSGTWRCLGAVNSSNDRVTLFMRIS